MWISFRRQWRKFRNKFHKYAGKKFIKGGESKLTEGIVKGTRKPTKKRNQENYLKRRNYGFDYEGIRSEKPEIWLL